MPTSSIKCLGRKTCLLLKHGFRKNRLGNEGERWLQRRYMNEGSDENSASKSNWYIQSRDGTCWCRWPTLSVLSTCYESELRLLEIDGLNFLITLSM